LEPWNVISWFLKFCFFQMGQLVAATLRQNGLTLALELTYSNTSPFDFFKAMSGQGGHLNLSNPGKSRLPPKIIFCSHQTAHGC
jgi:hypothetical protein